MSPAAFLSHGTGVRIPVPVPEIDSEKLFLFRKLPAGRARIQHRPCRSAGRHVATDRYWAGRPGPTTGSVSSDRPSERIGRLGVHL